MRHAPKAPNAVSVSTPMAPPEWALLERELLRTQAQAIEAFYHHYFDERGYLLCVPRWGGDDGPDDAAENFAKWPELHALGADDTVLNLYKKAWDGHLLQYSEARTVDVEFARDGMYFKEFPTMFDWMHNGEGFTAFFHQGLSDPYDKKFQDRTRRFIGFYMGEDPLADNWIEEHKVIKSMFNGSRGSMLRKATGLDWAGDPIEVEGRFDPGHGERNYSEMVAHFKDYNDVAGDHPLNMGITTVALNAFMIDASEKYYVWAKDYLDAWVTRTEENEGIVPTNIGLDGSLGGACDGKWYGGVYGWNFTVEVPQTGEMANRPFFLIRVHWSFANGLLLTGDTRYIDAWRGVIDGVNSKMKVIDGQPHYPRMYGDDGWYDYRPERFDTGARELYYWSMESEDLERVSEDPWYTYLNGSDPDFPVRSLRDDLNYVRERVVKMKDDLSTPDTRMSDDPNGINPGMVDALIQLMLGGLPTGHLGHPLHCRLRYFDPARNRAGIPEDVAALVDAMSCNEVSVTLVNVGQVVSRTVVVQGGAYGEHHIEQVMANDDITEVNGNSFTVHLEPGCGCRLTVKMNRYANRPTFIFPWDRK